MVDDSILSDDFSSIVLAPVKRKKGAKNKLVVNVHSGVAHVLATLNNTKVNITDVSGNVLAWSSAGKVGFKGSKKSTAYAAQVAGAECAKRAISYGLKEISVKIKGPGAGREAAVKGLASVGLNISEIADITPIPHNGCRPPKRRRV
jgi:small subunit ribosomal protein S11